MIIMKFGGSSIRDADRIRHVVELIKERVELRPTVVFSASGNTTDLLLKLGANALTGNPDLSELEEHHLTLADELGVDPAPIKPLIEELLELLKGVSLIKELSPKTRDYRLSFGERLSVRLIAPYMKSQGIEAKHYDGWELGFLTDSTFNDAEILPESAERIRTTLASVTKDYDHTPVITGFIAKDKDGNITTLGRGGSDLTASAVGAALSVEEIQVWKDVDGILTTDPRVVKEAQPVPQLSFEEAAELAFYGAKVLHPLSIQPAMVANIPVRVKNSYNPEHPGSVIISSAEPDSSLIKALTCKRSVTLIDIVSSRMLGQYGFLAQVFQVFNDAHISVDMVATSEVSVSLTLINHGDLTEVVAALEEFARVNVSHNKAILSLIGNMERSSEILDRAFKVLSQCGINVQMISQGASKVNVGMIVDDNQIDESLQQLHSIFFDSTEKAA